MAWSLLLNDIGISTHGGVKRMRKAILDVAGEKRIVIRILTCFERSYFSFSTFDGLTFSSMSSSLLDVRLI